ncbi:lysine--tRNA ligase [Methanospirillum stamsii]|uniref:Lysine--tRNA ligase n=1 Tax=Methanospirillum stamsii TaxID=1277351 RepID=A0A2V2N531_9EURY|nr:lysine--tRNA ligase [Methanospirillum stamsii]PWR75194.1 lysine--tRNA ligase [Methanospirillum stamsii]
MQDNPSIQFDDQRLAKRQQLLEEGISLYPHEYKRSHTIDSIRTQFCEAGHDPSSEVISTAGRLYGVRDHGKTFFADLRDETGRIQLYIRKDALPEGKFQTFKNCIERGDIIGVTGRVFKTKVGEISIFVDDLTLLTKTLCSLPEKFHGLTNLEKRYRQRYLDLIVNEESRDTFRTRSRIISLLRNYLTNDGFLEFETPTLQPLYGGANARPFTTFHNALGQKLYLRIAPELYLKRLVVGGFEKVFEVAKNFRNEDIDTSHNPEFSMVEIYQAYADYQDMMRLTESVISSIIVNITGGVEVSFEENPISYKAPWQVMTMEDAVRTIGGVDIFAHDIDSLRKIGNEKGVEGIEETSSLREMLVLFFEALVEDKLIQPTFITDFPVENSPLAKSHRVKEGYVERFELFIAGMEIANGFSELNDPLDQMHRFEGQEEKRRLGDEEAQMHDYDFVNALGYGMPPTGGVGIGIDRLVMLITGNSSIKEVILFPSMKREQVTPETDNEAVPSDDENA